MDTVSFLEDQVMDPVEFIEAQVSEQMGAYGNMRVGSFFLDDLISALLILIASIIIIRIVTFVLHRVLLRSKKMDATLRGFLEAAVKILMWMMAIISVAESLGIPTTSLVAAVSVVGLALSLSIQNIIANLFSGVTLLITKPFETGDYVDISGKIGHIQSVGLFYTVLHTIDNLRVNIPNADVTAAAVTNYSAQPHRRVDIDVSASYDTPTAVVKAAVREAMAGDDRILSDPEPLVAINQFGSSSIDYAVRVWCSPEDYWDVFFSMNERIRDCFEKHGAQMTYDHMNVHMM